MKKIVLLCALGVSTGMLVKKMQEAAEAEGFDASIEAHSVDDFADATQGADMVLLGPQVSFMVGDLQKKNPSMHIEPIDMLAYGTMNGKKVIARCRQVLGA